MKCPGRDDRNITAKIIKCKCGEEIEIFSDEKIIRCQNCKEICLLDGIPKCFEWCKHAKQCKEQL